MKAKTLLSKIHINIPNLDIEKASQFGSRIIPSPTVIQIIHCFTQPAGPEVKTSKVKGKPIPLKAWTGLEGSRSLKLPDFKTIGT
jgi:hypothetical protein